jgi:hypothetical protein
MKHLNINIQELELQFSKKKVVVKRVQKKDDGKGEDDEINPRKEKTKLPDAKQAQNIEIMLKKLPNLELLEKGIKNLDVTILTHDVLELMLKNVCATKSFILNY